MCSILITVNVFALPPCPSFRYPAVPAALRQVVERKTGLTDCTVPAEAVHTYGHFRGTWFYTMTVAVTDLPGASLPDVKALSVVVLSKVCIHAPGMYIPDVDPLLWCAPGCTRAHLRRRASVRLLCPLLLSTPLPSYTIAAIST